MCLLIGGKLLIPRLLGFLTALAAIPRLVDLFRDLKSRMLPAQLLAGQGDFLFPERRAVGLLFTRFVRRAKANHRPADNQRRLILHALRFKDGRFNCLRIVTVDLMHHVPVIGFKTFGGIIGKPAFGFTVNGDTVVVIEANEFAQPQRARQRADLVGDPLHQAAVAHKGIGIVIDNLMSRLVELCRQRALGNCQPHRVSQPLAEWAGGGLDARRIANLRMTWCF